MPRKNKEGISDPQEINEDTQILAETPVKEEPKLEKEPKYSSERDVPIGVDFVGKRFPDIYAGVCEFCGNGLYANDTSPQRLIEDLTVDPITQIGKCKHYKGVKVRCSYCPESADWAENIRHRKHVLMEDSRKPGILIICCSDMGCRTQHLKRYQIGN